MTHRPLAGMILCVLLLPCLAHADDFTEVPRTEKQLKLENECFKRHHELRQQHPDPKELGEAWKAEKKHCAGTGAYEYLLGASAGKAGDKDEAMRIYEDMVKRKLPYYENAFVALSMLRAEAAFEAKDGTALRAQRDALTAFAAAHRPSAFAYEQLASMNVGLKDWAAAVDASRKALAVDPANVTAHRQLVVGLHADEHCPDAVREIRPAIENDRQLQGDRNFMLSAADCYFETGDAKAGAAAIGALLREKPAIKDDPSVVQLVKYAASKGEPIP